MTEEKKKAAEGQPPEDAPKPPRGEKPKGAPKGESKKEAAKEAAPAEAEKDTAVEQPAEDKPAAKKSTRKTVAKEDRKFVTTSGEAVDNPEMGHAAGTQSNVDLDATHAERKAQAQPLRIAAIVLWVLGLVAEILCFVFLKGNKSMPWVITPLVVDFVLVVIGSQLWKKANHIDPPAKAEGAMYWLKTELGVVIAVIAFFPIIIVLLLDKNSDKRMKGIALIVAVVALVAAGASGVDYHPATQEGLDNAAVQASKLSDGGKCYWTAGGSVYHFNPDCSHLSHSAEIVQGTVSEAFDAGKTRGCKDCTEEGGSDVLSTVADNIVQLPTSGDSSAASNADGAASTESSENSQGSDGQEIQKAA